MPPESLRAPTLRNRGFALPWALFVLVALGLVGTTAVLTAWLDLRGARAFGLSTRAFYAADGALAAALAAPGLPASGADSFDLGAGVGRVTKRRILTLPGNEALYQLESRGTAGPPGRGVARTIGTVAWTADRPLVPGALVVAGPVAPGAATGLVTGVDTSTGCPHPPAAGVIAGGGPGGVPALTIQGTPPWRVPPAGTSVTALTGLRGPTLFGGGISPPDVTSPPDAWPTAGAGWPVIRVDGSTPLGAAHAGQGIILASGDLELAAGFRWRGLVIVRGDLRLLGDVTVRGALVVGLDPAPPSTADLGPHTVRIEYDACAIRSAGAEIAPLPVPLPGAWYERW